MRVLVVGGSGFLGSHIVDKFLDEGHEVTVYDLYPERFRKSPERIRFYSGDFGNIGAIEDVISSEYDAVIHCVSTTTPKSSNESPEFDIQSNVIGTLNLMDICVKHKVGKIVFISSGGTVYGDIGDAEMVNETHKVRPICSYGVSKLTIEHYLEMYKHLSGLEYVSLRLSNPYGERQSPLTALGALTVFLHRTLKRQKIEVWGDGSVTRDFIYVRDVADALYLAATNPKISGIYNIGSEVGRSLNSLLSDIGEVTKMKPQVTWMPARAFDVPRIILDTSKFRTASNWKPMTPLHTGIERTASWLRDADI